MLPLTLLYFFSTLLPATQAGVVQEGGSCTQANNHLQIGTYQFDGDCDSTTYCGSDNVCHPKGCRRDIFPFGYGQGNPNIPPLCPKGQFCPDEEDVCQDLLRVDSACQLNRDDECEAPPNFKTLANSEFGQNVNGSVCLNFQCMWANATLGSTCVVENTGYIAYGPNNQEFIQIVSRGNCMPGLYCDSVQLLCMQSKTEGVACGADKECATNNCLASQVCGGDISAAKHLGVWVYVVVGVCIFGGMTGTLMALFLLHNKEREKEREKRIQYWREQNAFRQNILQMRDTARASLLSLPLGANNTDSVRSTLYSREGMSSEESQVPMLSTSQPKASGLRHHISEDGERDEDLNMNTMVTERENEGPRYRSGKAF